MKFIAEIKVMPLKALLDPQGKTVMQSLNNIGYKSISNVRIGKHIFVEFEAKNKAESETIVNEICSRMLSNPIMESYEYSVFPQN